MIESKSAPQLNPEKKKAPGAGDGFYLDDFTPKIDTNIWLLSSNELTDELKAILDAGADANEVNPITKLTPLICAARAGRLESVRILLSRGAKPNVTGYGGMTALHHAASGMYEKVIAELVKAGGDVNIADSKGDTPCIIAAPKGVINLMTLILESGGDLNHANKFGASALHKAALNNQPTMAKKLAMLGANVNLQDSRGNTPLHYSCKVGSSACVKTLLMNGADKDLQNTLGESAVECAIDSKINEEFEKHKMGAFKRGAKMVLATTGFASVAKDVKVAV